MRARAFKEEIKFYLKKKGRVCFEIKILKIKSYHKPSFICSALFIKKKKNKNKPGKYALKKNGLLSIN